MRLSVGYTYVDLQNIEILFDTFESPESHLQGGSNFITIFSTCVFAAIFSLSEKFVLTISSPYQKEESYVKV